MAQDSKPSSQHSFLPSLLRSDLTEEYKWLRIPNLVLNIVFFIFSHRIPPSNEVMYTHFAEDSWLLSQSWATYLSVTG